MYRIRVIPTLLIRQRGLVKSVRFRKHRYVGDPINAVKIFNDKEVDEIVILDIDASVKRRSPDFGLIEEMAGEAFMPMAYGGGLRSVEQVKRVLSLGVEKIVINAAAHESPHVIRAAADAAGSQSVVVSIDVRRRFLLGGYHVHTHGGQRNTRRDPVDFAREAERQGAGEILLTSIDRDGTYEGYDLELIRAVSSAVRIPVVACGGAAEVRDFARAVDHGAAAVAAGSLFVFHGVHRAVLINFPPQDQLTRELFDR